MIKITTKHEIAQALFVLAAAASPKHLGNKILQYIAVQDNGMMQATDGHRMHQAQTEYSAGIYEIAKKTRSEVILVPQADKKLSDYPETSRVVPSIDGIDPIEKSHASVWQEYTRTVRAMQDDMTLNYDYFAEALSATDNIYIPDSKLAPVVFAGVGTLAVVMPCSL
jgi:hypothetical protein